MKIQISFSANKIVRHFLFLILLGLNQISISFCQENVESDEIPSSFAEISGFLAEDGWYYFENGLDSTLSAEVFTTFKNDFELTQYDEIFLADSHKDNVGFVHSSYRQFYKGIPVEGSMLVTHMKDAKIQNINGSYGKIWI